MIHGQEALDAAEEAFRLWWADLAYQLDDGAEARWEAFDTAVRQAQYAARAVLRKERTRNIEIEEQWIRQGVSHAHFFGLLDVSASLRDERLSHFFPKK